MNMRTGNSKYIGRVYDGFMVYAMEKTEDGIHNRFFLARYTGAETELIQLRDNELTRLTKGLTTISSLLDGKEYQRAIDCNYRRNLLDVKKA